MKKIIIFNGPPGSGKDEGVQQLYERVEISPLSFKTPLIDATARFFNVSMEWWEHNYTRIGKETPQEELRGYTPREALIHVAEHVLKPVFGYDIIGRAVLPLIQDAKDDIVAFPDGGFPEEIAVLIEEFGAENILIIKIEREGFRFEGSGDSRYYISTVDLPAAVYEAWVVNNGTLGEYAEEIMRCVSAFIEK